MRMEDLSINKYEVNESNTYKDKTREEAINLCRNYNTVKVELKKIR